MDTITTKEMIESTIHVPIIKYKTFSTTEEFEAWQNESTRRIYQIQPLITTVNTNQVKDGMPNDMDMKLNISVFVTYLE